jgi:hypothetical protein
MLRLIHKYFRRAIVWAQTLSEEEEEVEALRREEMLRAHFRRRIPQAFNRRYYPSDWVGLGPLQSMLLADEIEKYGKANGHTEGAIQSVLNEAVRYSRLELQRYATEGESAA